MRSNAIRKKIMELVSEEIRQGSQFIDRKQLIDIRRRLSDNEPLCMDIRRNLADYVVGQNIGECDGHEYEELVDWLLHQGE